MNFRKILALSLLAPAFLAPGAGALNNFRHNHTATLLPDGNILITGGVLNTATVTDSVEMYDMISNTYINWAGGLVTERSSHTATLMSDGRVLIAGGFGTTGLPLASLEICDPRLTVRTCAAAGAMLTTRGGHTATLLSRGPRAGQVLLCGGRDGVTGTSVTGNCETFNPVGQTVLPAGAMLSPREGHAAVLLRSGRVFVTGGRRRNLADSLWIYEPMNEMYDPATGAGIWTPVAALLQGRISHTATVLNNGKIMIAGGYNASNVRYCKEDEDSLEDECWHIKEDPFNDQNAGNQGYLDGAEFFDQNGARVVVQEETYGEIPYRIARHTALLEPDGRWRMHGGYGNIYPTFFTNSPTLDAASVIDLTPTGNNTATIDNTSLIRFPLKFGLSRPVSGRLVDADAFISLPPATNPITPTFEMDTAKFYLPVTTVPVDASPVGLLLGEYYEPGNFDDIVQIPAPSGTAVFSKQEVSSGDNPITTVVGSAITMATLFPEQTGEPIGGSVNAQVRLTVPDTYRSIVGLASVLSGTITDSDDVYIIPLNEAGSGTFDILNPVSCDPDANTCVFTANINFTGISGTINNLTTLTDGVTVYQAAPPPGPLDSSVNTADSDEITLSLELSYVARQVSVLDRTPTYIFDRSTMVIRGMIFSSQLSYNPKNNTWGDLTDKEESPAMFTPSFNHTALLTPAADTVKLGGRNCEFSPDADCLRSVMRFSTATVDRIGIPVYRGTDGGDMWPAGEALNSKRAFHTSTLLPDGGILTCGGSDGVRPMATCEMMDSLTKKWAVTGSMNSPRANHTATLLPNGTVLAAGGITPDGIAVSSAEIYYPDTRRWAPTSSMANVRQLHTATLMPDGNVLVTGGAMPGAYSTAAELYISSAAYWLTTGSMADGRSQHTATLLKTGNVLVAGGINDLGAMRETEIYNYLTRTFGAGPLLNFARYAHTANQLRDGNVIVIGGSDNIDSMKSCEIYNGTAWAETVDLTLNRANHRSVLLPNGKIMLTGGEMSGVAQSVPEGFDPDFRNWSTQGTASGRTHHTSLITRDNLLITMGGWSGGSYLDTTEQINFNFYPDMNGLEAETTRQAIISSSDRDLFDRGDNVTLLGNTSNFHGITEASGGGAGPANASFHNPRVYMQQIDNPSGFMVDLSTWIYSLYGGINANWEKTLSSITIIMPNQPGVMPHGWYHMRVAAAGVFSDGRTVQVTVPRPTGVIAFDSPAGTVLSSTSIRWDWTQNTLSPSDGYVIFSSSNNVIISTAAFTPAASYTQSGMKPNTEISVKIGGYNLGGVSTPLQESGTYYTNAVEPVLTLEYASFETVLLTWNPMGNSPLTIYEVTMSKSPAFLPASEVQTPVPFTENQTTTSAVIISLLPNQPYSFRVQAKSGRLGSGVVTGYSNVVTTITVSNVTNLAGSPRSKSEINWTWDPATGAPPYEVYDVTAGTGTLAVFLTSTTVNSYLQSALSTNTWHEVAVNAYNGLNKGPVAYSPAVYTLAVPPLPGVPQVYTNITTGSFTLNWRANGNPADTDYYVAVNITSDLTEAAGAYIFQVTGTSTSLADLDPNTLYYSAVSARNGDGVATSSAAFGSEYTLAQAPVDLKSTNIAMSGISLAWSGKNNPGDTTYEVRGSTTLDDLSTTTPKNLITYIPFSAYRTSNSAGISGLLTSTSYYFDVAAYMRTSSKPPGPTGRAVSPAVLTLPGPGGAPPGSVGGTSSAGKDSTISGILPNGTTVALYIPAGAFATETAIAISSSVTNSCAQTAIPVVEVAIWTDGSQPQVPVTLTLNYNNAAAATITPNIARLVIARYNPVSGDCLPLDTKVDPGPRTITARLNHFSIFQLMVRSVPSDLSGVRIYPNPFYTNRGQGFVTINNVPAGTEAVIYTLSGDKVWEGTAGSSGMLTWDATNNSGVLVASGIYLAALDSTGGKKVFKIAVER